MQQPERRPVLAAIGGVPAVVLEQNWGASTNRVVAGLSMGGQGALLYAARHPGMFRAAAAYSGSGVAARRCGRSRDRDDFGAEGRRMHALDGGRRRRGSGDRGRDRPKGKQGEQEDAEKRLRARSSRTCVP
ncbi:MAG TPA: alpha/beta hydrolase-fold protein [Kribbella sp.]